VLIPQQGGILSKQAGESYARVSVVGTADQAEEMKISLITVVDRTNNQTISMTDKVPGEYIIDEVVSVGFYQGEKDGAKSMLVRAKVNVTIKPEAGETAPSISSTGMGNEIQANENIARGILDIGLRQGVIKQNEYNIRREMSGEDMSNDIELAVDNVNVFEINGQKVIVIDAPYLSVTEEGEQYASAGLRRGVVYMTREKFEEWQKTGVLEQKILHEQDEVSYLRDLAQVEFPDVDAQTAIEKMSQLLKDPENSVQAKGFISQAHSFASNRELINGSILFGKGLITDAFKINAEFKGVKMVDFTGSSGVRYVVELKEGDVSKITSSVYDNGVLKVTKCEEYEQGVLKSIITEPQELVYEQSRIDSFLDMKSDKSIVVYAVDAQRQFIPMDNVKSLYFAEVAQVKLPLLVNAIDGFERVNVDGLGYMQMMFNAFGISQ
ncbi:MAG: hypothetical protein ABII88_00175, partial [Candidatus Omnitrophota bacterium]